jgi:hypothetical protein
MSNVAVIDREEGRSIAEPRSFLEMAIASGNIDIVERAMAVQERNDANRARKAFDAALSAAKAEIPVIAKNRSVGYANSDGKGRTEYRHEDLAEIARTVDPILGKHGLSYRFRTTSEVNQPITVTCILSHRDGHFEENTLIAGKDDSGKKNSIQAIGSTITYLQRYTLKAALGLAASNDDDGQKSEVGREINEDEFAALNALIHETDTDIGAFCKVCKVDFLAQLTIEKFPAAIAKLQAKKARMAREAQS